MTSPFDFLNSISQTKVDLMVDPQSEKEYVPFIVNRSLSYHQDTVLYANEMNMRASIPNRQQFAYLMNSIRPRKRFAKWSKTEKQNNQLLALQKYYSCNLNRAKEYLNILTENQIENIMKLVVVD